MAPPEALEYRILGSFEVAEGSRLLALGSGQERALLAILLLHANERVSTDRLIDLLWGETPPATAPKMIQIYVSRLRRALEADPAAGQRLETHLRGYRLRIAADELDIERFERLRAEGGAALASGDAEGAAATLREALALWRGPPLADFALAPFAQEEINRLRELRQTVLEERIEAEFALGRGPKLVPELETLVAQNPLRERLAAQLMLALYRADRQADALAVYKRTRHLLVDELGIEPGRRLKELEQAILRQDSRLDPAALSAGESVSMEAALAPDPQPELEPQAQAPVQTPAASRLPTRRTWAMVAAALVLAAAAGVTATVLLTRSGADGLGSIPPNSLGVIDPATNRIVAAVPTGGRPDAVAVGYGYVWIVNVAYQAITKVEVSSRKVERTISLDAPPTDVAVGEGWVWVAHQGPLNTLTRIQVRAPNAATSIELPAFPVPNPLPGGTSREPACGWPSPASAVVGRGVVWVLCASQFGEASVIRIDAATRRAYGSRFPGYPSASAVAYGLGALWVAELDQNTVAQVDPDSREALSVLNVAPGPAGVVTGYGSVWLSARKGGAVTRLTPAPGLAPSIRTISVGRGPVDVAAGSGGVWVTNTKDRTISRIDPRTNRVTATIRTGSVPQDVAVGAGLVWVTTQPP